MSKNIKILFICKKNNSSYGSSFGLINSCRLIAKAFFEKTNIDAKVVEVIDNNCIDREVHNYQPTHVVIEALWVVPEKFHVLLKLYPKVKWYVRIHSEIPFLSNEGIAFDWLFKYYQISLIYDNLFISANSESCKRDLERVIPTDVIHLPNIYLINDSLKKHKTGNKHIINIGCFGAIRPLKNQLSQAIAAIAFANIIDKQLCFHINASRVEQKGEEVLKNLVALFDNSGHKLIMHRWYNHEEFIKVINKMDLGMQVSFSETFNIVAADFVSQNIPIVVSPEIEWASIFYKCSPTNITKMINKLGFAHSNPSMQILNKLSLHAYNKRALHSWEEELFCEE